MLIVEMDSFHLKKTFMLLRRKLNSVVEIENTIRLFMKPPTNHSVINTTQRRVNNYTLKTWRIHKAKKVVDYHYHLSDIGVTDVFVVYGAQILMHLQEMIKFNM